jgi:hypothetical protein
VEGEGNSDGAIGYSTGLCIIHTTRSFLCHFLQIPRISLLMTAICFEVRFETFRPGTKQIYIVIT